MVKIIGTEVREYKKEIWRRKVKNIDTDPTKIWQMVKKLVNKHNATLEIFSGIKLRKKANSLTD